MKFHSFGLKKHFAMRYPVKCMMWYFLASLTTWQKTFMKLHLLICAGKNVTRNFIFSILNKTKHLKVFLENVEKLYEKIRYILKLHKIFGYTAVVELYDGRTQTLASFLSWKFFSHSRFAKRGVTDPREDKKFWFLWLDTF